MDDPILIWATVVQAAATVVGFMFVGWQALELKQTIRGDAHDSLYSHYAGVITMLAAKPYLHPYLYDNKPIGEGDPQHPNLRQEMDLVSESILALIEHAVMYRKELPDDAWNNCWLPYARERFKTSASFPGSSMRTSTGMPNHFGMCSKTARQYYARPTKRRDACARDPKGYHGPARRRTAVRGTGKFPAGGEGSGILLGPSSNRGPVLEFWQSRRQTPHTQRATTCSPKPLDDGSCPGADPRGFGNAGTFRARTQVDLLITSC